MLALLTIALAVRPAWRARWGVPLAIANVVMLGFILLVTGSGEQLERHIGAEPLIVRHRELGEQLRMIWALFTAVTVGLAIVDRRARSERAAGWMAPVATALTVLSVVGAIASTVWDVRTGHAGAKSAWEDTPSGTAKGYDGGD
ncbi:hypothetical protein PAI11_05810 [Patulibacter medicamentivorans]|uniref:DUF2231 domain-containing protein n=1 Tax=Patulibacter medicamentivorans TaxID=1097667 RepID=H0E1B9_9ACTN|nr:hypothetical protein PAI11_05810 [Patulibacter medicamentivorans]